MSPHTIIDCYPLSPMQQGMLLHTLKEPTAGNDVEQMVCMLPEAIDPAVMRHSWQRVIERHPALRTAFHFEDGDDLRQVVYSEMPLDWAEQDWRNVAEAERSSRLSMLLSSDRHRVFHLSEGPLLRLTLLRMAEAEYCLIWTFHHALIDGRSFPHILNEVFAVYESLLSGCEAGLPQPRPYRDYIDWLSAHDSSQAESYWREQLAGFSTPTHLPIGATHSLPANAMDRQGDDHVFVSKELTESLNGFAQAQGVTLNTLVQAAWALLLSRYSGENDVLYGVVRACRKSSVPSADEIVGLFINTLPLRLRIPQDSILSDWLKQVRTQWTGMRDHEHTPLVQIQKWSAVPSDTPLFESILMFETYQLDQRLRNQGGKWAKRSFRLYEQTGYPITLTVYSGTELCLQIEFDRTRFEADAIHRMLGHLRTLLEAMPGFADRPLRELPMLTREEAEQIIVEWNDTARAYPSRSTVHELFERQAALSPDSVALMFEGKQLTYLDLNARANRLSHLLREQGIGPEKLVAICLERSLEMVIAVLAVLKAGGAYVPLDPSFPKERLALVLEDSRATVLITQKALTASLPDFRGAMLAVDTLELSSRPDDNLANTTHADNLAYVIFTSGSTGRPKGVQIEHRSVVNFLESMRREPGLAASDTLVAVTTLSFDIAGLELFLPLTTGARVAIASHETTLDGRRLAQLIEKCSATVMQATPATWRLLLENGWTGQPDLKILCGGEALPSELAEELIPRCSSLWNVYGPTETTIWSTLYRVDSAKAPISIGKPIANTQVLVLDRYLYMVPVGVPGELFIGGDGLARGYLNRPDLTAERFIPNPSNPSARLYRTGDLCRWRPDGSLECLGRNDHQVKIRGHRIELGEIETALVSHPAIKQAVVTVQERKAGDKLLAAYLVPANGQVPPSSELRTYLADRLPDYMLPAAYLQLSQLPLTPNGKIDRRALPPIVEPHADADQRWTAPESDIERTIASVWEELLHVNGVGRSSNFFDLGGDSLLMIGVRSKLEQALQREIPILEMFRHSTVTSLASYLGGAKTAPAAAARSRKEIAASKESAHRRLQLRKSRVS